MGFILAAAFVLIAIGFAVMRGASRAVFRIILVVVSFIGALAAALVVKSMAASEQAITWLSETGGAEVSALISQIGEYSPSLVKILMGSTVSFLAPLVFLVTFIALLVATWVLYFLITLILFPIFHNKEKNTKARKLKALVVGAVQGALVLFCVMSPVSYYGTMLQDAVPALEENGVIEDIAQGLNVPAEDVKSSITSESPLMNANSTFGGKAFCKILTTFTFEDMSGEKVKINIADEFEPILDISLNVIKLSSTPVEEFDDEQAEAIKAIGESFSKSPFLKVVSSEMVAAATEAWKNGESFANIEKPSVGEPIDIILDNMIKIFNESSKSSENFGTDVKDLTEIVAVMIEADVLKEMGEPNVLLEKLSTGNTINDVTSILRSNERLRPVISDITTLSIYILADSLGIPADKETAYVNMLNDVAAKLNETKEMDIPERIETLKPFIKNEFDMIGAEVDEEYIESVCQALVTDFGDVEEVTPEFIAEFFAIYGEYRGEVGGTTEVSDNGGSEVTDLGEGGGYTFGKYQTEDGRNQSGAAIVGKLDAAIIEISGSDATPEEKRAELEGLVSDIMAPIFNGLVENSQDKEKAEEIIGRYSETVGNLSEKAQSSNIQSSNNLVSFASSSSANVNCMTLGDIKDKFSGSGAAIDEAETDKHSQIINDIVGCASSLLAATNNGGGEESEGSSDGVLDIIKSATEGLGSILDTLSETELYGREDTANLMQSILTSDTVSNVLPLTKEETDILIDQIKNNENASYGSLMTGVSGTAELIISITEGNCTEDSVKKLIISITEENVDAILVIVSEKRFESMGLSADKIATTNEIIKTLLTELAKVPEEKVDTEAKAVKKLIDVLLEAKGGGASLFGENGVLGEAEDFIDEILASEAVSNTVKMIDSDPFGIAVNMSDADKTALETACESYMGTEDEETVKAIAMLFGITLG